MFLQLKIISVLWVHFIWKAYRNNSCLLTTISHLQFSDKIFLLHKIVCIFYTPYWQIEFDKFMYRFLPILYKGKQTTSLHSLFCFTSNICKKWYEIELFQSPEWVWSPFLSIVFTVLSSSYSGEWKPRAKFVWTISVMVVNLHPTQSKAQADGQCIRFEGIRTNKLWHNVV